MEGKQRPWGGGAGSNRSSRTHVLSPGLTYEQNILKSKHCRRSKDYIDSINNYYLFSKIVFRIVELLLWVRPFTACVM